MTNVKTHQNDCIIATSQNSQNTICMCFRIYNSP